MFPRIFRSFVIAAVAFLPLATRAQDQTLAGWTFSQFIFQGVPTIDAVNLGATDHIVATYRDGLPLPLPSVVDGTTIGNAGASTGYDVDTIGSWSFSAFVFDNGVDVVVNEEGGPNTVNSTLLGGADMSDTDVAGRGLGFTTQNVFWTIQVNDLAGYAQASGPDLTFAAYGVGGSATVEWFVGDQLVGQSVIAQNSGNYATYSLELNSAFYASGNLKGRLVAGNGVSFDNVQINGQPGTPPQFTAQPQGLVRLVGESATFSVTVSGADAPTYQWQKGTATLDGQTSSSLTIPAVTLADAGDYTVTVRSSNGLTATSEVAALVVRQAPAITQSPANQTANPGQTVTFTVVATGTPAPTYRWQRGEVDLVASDDIVGVTSSTLTLRNVTEASEGNYRVIVSNPVTDVPSAAASLSVSALEVAPTVSTAPADTTGVAGGEVELTVVASGAPAPTYQWFYEGEPLVDGVGIAGATTDRLRLSGLTTGRAGTYTVVVTNSAGVVEREAELVVQTKPSIVSGPGPAEQAVVAGSNVTFKVVVAGDPVPSIQWLRNGREIEGETTDTLALTGVTSANDGAYAARVTNAAGEVTSETSLLTVGTAAMITAHPQSVLVSVGATTTLSVTAVGNPEPSYQWFRGEQPIENATESTLTLDAVTAANAGIYQVRVFNSFATDLSDPATVRVAEVVNNNLPNKVQTYAPGSTLYIGSTTGAVNELTYVWFLNGKRIVGASGRTISIENAAIADSGTYTVQIFNSVGKKVGSRVVARLAISPAANYDALVRDVESDEPIGRVQVVITKTGAFTGQLRHEDGKTYAFKGVLVFGDNAGSADLTGTIKRTNPLGAFTYVLGLDAQAKTLSFSLRENATVLGDAAGDLRLGTTAVTPWAGTYSLALTPLPTQLPDQPTALATLKAVVAPKGGTIKITGKLADATLVTGSFSSSTAADYATWFSLYAAKGRLAGGLSLFEITAGVYGADLESSGEFVWFRPANAKSKTFPGGIDLLLSPELTRP